MRRKRGFLTAVVSLVALTSCGQKEIAREAIPSPSKTAQTSPSKAPTPSPSNVTLSSPSKVEPSPQSEGEPSPQRPEHLWDRAFVSVTVTQDGEPRPLVSGTRIEVAFEKRQPEGVGRWQAGCNIIGSTVQITEERLVIGDDLAGTSQGCREELYEQDRWLTGFFRSNPHWELSGDRLTLATARTVMELEKKHE